MRGEWGGAGSGEDMQMSFLQGKVRSTLSVNKCLFTLSKARPGKEDKSPVFKGM